MMENIKIYIFSIREYKWGRYKEIHYDLEWYFTLLIVKLLQNYETIKLSYNGIWGMFKITNDVSTSEIVIEN